MPPSDDMELLREYVEHGSEAAFEAILNRHVNLVYSTALRQVREPHLAGEVTQTAFIILARKARSFGSGTILSGWLYRTTQFAANRALRTEARRRDREREAAQMQTDQTDQTDSVWEHLSPILDQAMAQLGAADRNAIVLRYFENKNSKDVGAALGVNEAAAQKRVARAVEKLRGLCTKRGVVLPAVALVGLISANAVHAAPSGMVNATSTALGGGLSGSTAALVKGTLQLLTWAKYRIAAYAGVGLAIFVGTSFLAVEQAWFQPKYQNRSLASWLAQLDDNHRDYVLLLYWQPWEKEVHLSPEQAQAAQAVRAIGAPALPYLMSDLKMSDSLLNNFLGKFGAPPDAARRRALLALDALGPQCKPVIPELTQMLYDDKSPKDAAAILGAIGPDGWRVLTQALTSTNHMAAACGVWSLGSRRAAVPGTVETMESNFVNNAETGTTPLTGWALAEIGQDREQVVSLLIKGLSMKRQDSKWGCAVSLGQMGPDAISAVPNLLPMLKDLDPIISHDAAQAIAQIDPQTAARVGAASALAHEHVPKMTFSP